MRKFTWAPEKDGERPVCPRFTPPRYYSNGLGRFITPDWAAKPAAVPYVVLGDPQSLNLYGYVRNIPTTRYDADGHCGDDGACGNVKVTVTAPPVDVVQNQQVGKLGYRSGVGTTPTITFTDQKNNPISGMSVKESPTTKDNLTGKPVPEEANKEAVTTSDRGTIKDLYIAPLRSDSEPHTFTPQDLADMIGAATTMDYSRTTTQTLTFSIGAQSCTCTYSETLTNLDAQGNLNLQTNANGLNFTFTPTTPVVKPTPSATTPTPTPKKDQPL
jgi:RHS repeat-associated protein